MYSAILKKHTGWFDDKENTPGILSTSLASDAQVINGVSAEGLASIIVAGFSVLTGIAIGFIYCWQESLVCIGTTPFTIFGGGMQVKLQKGLS
jgi:hypothetical protein